MQPEWTNLCRMKEQKVQQSLEDDSAKRDNTNGKYVAILQYIS